MNEGPPESRDSLIDTFLAELTEGAVSSPRTRFADLVDIHGATRSLSGDIMAIRCFDSAEIAYVSGAFAAAAICATAAIRHELQQRMHMNDCECPEGAGINVSVSTLADCSRPCDLISASQATAVRGLAKVEERYDHWSTPFAPPSMEDEMRSMIEKDECNGWENLACAQRLMQRDALASLSVACDLLRSD